MKGQGTGNIYGGSFLYILLSLGPEKSFVIPTTSLYRGSINRGYTVLKSKHVCCCTPLSNCKRSASVVTLRDSEYTFSAGN